MIIIATAGTILVTGAILCGSFFGLVVLPRPYELFLIEMFLSAPFLLEILLKISQETMVSDPMIIRNLVIIIAIVIGVHLTDWMFRVLSNKEEMDR